MKNINKAAILLLLATSLPSELLANKQEKQEVESVNDTGSAIEIDGAEYVVLNGDAPVSFNKSVIKAPELKEARYIEIIPDYPFPDWEGISPYKISIPVTQLNISEAIESGVDINEAEITYIQDENLVNYAQTNLIEGEKYCNYLSGRLMDTEYHAITYTNLLYDNDNVNNYGWPFQNISAGDEKKLAIYSSESSWDGGDLASGLHAPVLDVGLIFCLVESAIPQ